jgi:hypothetical protein
MLRWQKPGSVFTYIPALSALHATIGGWVLTPRSINYVIKVTSLYSDTIAIGDTPYVVLATGPGLDPSGFIGLRGNGLTPSKIDDFLSEPSL